MERHGESNFHEIQSPLNHRGKPMTYIQLGLKIEGVGIPESEIYSFALELEYWTCQTKERKELNRRWSYRERIDLTSFKLTLIIE